MSKRNRGSPACPDQDNGSRDREGAANTAQPLANGRGSPTASADSAVPELESTGGNATERGLHPDDVPLAYLITFTCYGTWLPGDERGSVDRQHNIPGTPVLAPNPARERAARQRMSQPPYQLDAARREVVVEAIQEVCRHRQWALLAAHVRRRHVHVVVQAFADGGKVMNSFKAYASRRLNDQGFDRHGRKRWTRRGSVRKLWTMEDVEAAVDYVVRRQGEPMALFVDLAAIARLAAEAEERERERSVSEGARTVTDRQPDDVQQPEPRPAEPRPSASGRQPPPRARHAWEPRP